VKRGQKRKEASCSRRLKEAEKEDEGKKLVPLLKEHEELAKRERDLQKIASVKDRGEV